MERRWYQHLVIGTRDCVRIRHKSLGRQYKTAPLQTSNKEMNSATEYYFWSCSWIIHPLIEEKGAIISTFGKIFHIDMYICLYA